MTQIKKGGLIWKVTRRTSVYNYSDVRSNTARVLVSLTWLNSVPRYGRFGFVLLYLIQRLIWHTLSICHKCLGVSIEGTVSCAINKLKLLIGFKLTLDRLRLRHIDNCFKPPLWIDLPTIELYLKRWSHVSLYQCIVLVGYVPRSVYCSVLFLLKFLIQSTKKPRWLIVFFRTCLLVWCSTCIRYSS